MMRLLVVHVGTTESTGPPIGEDVVGSGIAVVIDLAADPKQPVVVVVDANNIADVLAHTET